MFFRVENLGPLREAEVDLSKELILLTGPNSTGKTYLAWSVFGLFRSPEARGALRPVVDEILASPAQEVDFQRIRDLWPSVLDAVAAWLADSLHLCFATTRQSFPDARVTLRAIPGEPDGRGGSMRFSRLGNGIQGGIRIGPRISIRLDELREPESSAFQPLVLSDIPQGTREELLKRLDAAFSSTILSVCWPRCTLLPAERTAVDLFAKELSSGRNELVNEVVEAELDGGADLSAITRRVGRYPWPIQDSLRIANDLTFFARRESRFADLAAELETLLCGTVSLSEHGEFRFAPREGAVEPIGIHLTSSVVKSLVSLVFFLRHRARPGDLLMIDEPELNLHPDNQRSVARVLARAVNRGLRVIMSTHSDYILREINNLILLSRDTAAIKELRARHGYTDAELLAPEKIGAYLFRHGRSEAISVTEDGFEVQTIEDEINRMNEVSQEIYAALL